MIPISEEIQNHILQICIQNYPNESCGFILKNNQIYYVGSGDQNHAMITAQDFLEAEKEGEVQIIWHSHTKENNIDFSKTDIELSYSLNFPLFLIHIPSNHRRYFDPFDIQPYANREWKIYQNCYTLGRDIYKKELGIELKPFIFENKDDWRSLNPFEVIRPYEMGFIDIPIGSRLQKYDVLLFRPPGAKNPVHIGIFYDTDLGYFWHHSIDSPSELAILGESWQYERVLRHQRLC